MKIGNVELENNIILAPMAGVSDLPFRLHLQGAGCRNGLHGNGECKSHFLP